MSGIFEGVSFLLEIAPFLMVGAILGAGIYSVRTESKHKEELEEAFKNGKIEGSR